MVNFTVAICTYNGEKRLSQVLERLKAQIITTALSWDVLIIDNNSTDRTAEVVQSYQMNWRKDCALIYCYESKQGLAFARQRAILSARGQFVGFLDDDNLPSLDWVEQAYQFGKTHPQAGAYGGQIQGDFEVEPPQNFKKIACFLAIVKRGEKAFIYKPERKMLPPGAGLVVRRNVWKNSVPAKLLLKGRVRKSMLASEDLEAICHIQNAGWEIWYAPTLKIHHQIPRSRFEPSYLISLIGGIGLARHHIRMLRISPWKRPFFTGLYAINDLKKIILYALKNGSSIQNDLITTCEWEFLWSSFISPFYLFIQWMMDWFVEHFSVPVKTWKRLSSAR